MPAFAGMTPFNVFAGMTPFNVFAGMTPFNVFAGMTPFNVFAGMTVQKDMFILQQQSSPQLYNVIKVLISSFGYNQ